MEQSPDSALWSCSPCIYLFVCKLIYCLSPGNKIKSTVLFNFPGLL